jgi:hypothetical protein
MKRWFFIAALIVSLLAQAAPALASCTTNTIYSGGRMVMCTTCCFGSQCTTNCF